MSMGKMAMTGMIGFAIGAGTMMMPSSQKMKRRMMTKLDKLVKMAKAW